MCAMVTVQVLEVGNIFGFELSSIQNKEGNSMSYKINNAQKRKTC